MKGGDHTIQLESHPRASPFNGLRSEGQQQGLDTLPFQATWNSIIEDKLQGFAVCAIHVYI